MANHMTDSISTSSLFIFSLGNRRVFGLFEWIEILFRVVVSGWLYIYIYIYSCSFISPLTGRSGKRRERKERCIEGKKIHITMVG